MVSESKPKDFGAFEGVFVPTFLSIIGVILFLRLGTIVGSAGVLGTIVIIILAISLTAATALSLSSITTDIRIGGGGAYSIIRKTLGLEVGGSVGIPLYLAQIFSVALYIFGFVEAWRFIFPNHPPTIILGCAFVSLLLLKAISTELAVNAQKIVFVIVLASLVSIFLGTDLGSGLTVPLQNTAEAGQFWILFALFFPATTGLMAGIGLSGRLTDPKRQIPVGVLSAVGLSTIVYLAVTFWLGNVSDPTALVNNTDVIVNQAAVPAIVLAGILAATFSSALTTFTAAPELLASMGNNRVIPFDKTLSKREDGEPKRAVYFSAVIVGVILLLGNLDTVAPILTMFFLISYAMINFSVFLEKSLGNVSFRPTLKIPGWVSLYGAITSLVFMFMINPFAAVFALIFMFLAYLVLVHQNLNPEIGDARSGLFREIAQWAAEKVNKLPEGNKHNWKPNILLPVITTRTLLGNFPMIKSIAYPNGTMTVLGFNLTSEEGETPLEENKGEDLSELPSLVEKFGKEHLFVNSSMVDVSNYTNGICISLESIESQIFHPNLLYLSFTPDNLPLENIERIFKTARKSSVGVLMLDRDKELGLGTEKILHVWIPEEEMEKSVFDEKSYDLAMIIAYRLYTNWEGDITIHMATSKDKEERANAYVERLLYEARFPRKTNIKIHTKPLERAVADSSNSDIHIMPVKPESIEDVKHYTKLKGKTMLYCMDGTEEDILA